jgi:tetratricopeptide (TPR) repeat protein
MRRAFVIFWILALLVCRPFASASEDDHPYVSALRSLSVNRSLLTKAQTEYRVLLQEGPLEPDEETAGHLSDLRYKIQALQDDAERLRSALPPDRKAEEFLQEMVRRQKALGDGSRAVDIEAEKRLEEKVRAIYDLHEQALSHVAAGRLDEAQRVYEDITLLSPDDDEAYLLLGHSCLAAGHYEKAAAAFRNAMHIEPSNEREIPRLYENILVENPSDDQAMTLLGYAYLLLGDAREARLAFEEALKINASNEAAKRGLLEIP